MDLNFISDILGDISSGSAGAGLGWSGSGDHLGTGSYL